MKWPKYRELISVCDKFKFTSCMECFLAWRGEQYFSYVTSVLIIQHCIPNTIIKDKRYFFHFTAVTCLTGCSLNPPWSWMSYVFRQHPDIQAESKTFLRSEMIIISLIHCKYLVQWIMTKSERILKLSNIYLWWVIRIKII